MARVIIEGFKTIKEAQNWANAYEGGVEQDMSIWAEVKPFPCMTEDVVKKGDDIVITLRQEEE